MSKNRIIEIYRIQQFIPGEKLKVKSKNPKYHYTSPDGFLAIIKYSSLHFTDIRYFNDKSENTYIYHCIRLFLNKHPNKYNVLRELMKTIFSDADGLDINRERPKFPFSDKPKRVFVFCTSTDPDSLSMWNYYVKNGNYSGYSIGLNPTQIIKSLEKYYNKIEVLFGNVIYNEKDQLTEIQLIAGLLEEYFAGEENKMRGLALLYLYCQQFSPFFKNEKFSHEKEYRFVISIDEDKLSDCLTDDLKFDYRISNGIVVPYLKLAFDKKALKQIYLSPNTEVEISKESILGLCKKCGYDKVSINASKVPIRF